MDEAAYRQYVTYKNAGRKAQAKVALGAFLASLKPADDTQAWTKAFLEGEDVGHQIRHEIYERLVFPVLWQGYEHNDAWSLLWLAKTVNNLYRSPALHALIGYKSERELLMEAYRLQPSDEVQQLLLNADLRFFAYSQHEWPAGILYGSDGASLAECDDILQQVSFARGLDTGDNEAFLNAFESKVREYKMRL
jgi:hypothetical protein